MPGMKFPRCLNLFFQKRKILFNNLFRKVDERQVRIICLVDANSEIFEDVSKVILCQVIIKCPRKMLKPTMPTFVHVTFLRHRTSYSVLFLKVEG